MVPAIRYQPFMDQIFEPYRYSSVQHLHHRRLLLCILYQHRLGTAHVLDNVNNFTEARCCTSGLGETSEAKVGSASVLQDDEELDDERYGLDLEICKTVSLA